MLGAYNRCSCWVDFTKEQLEVEPFYLQILSLLLNANDLALCLLVCHAQSQLVLLNSALSVRSIEEVMSVTKSVPDVLSDLSARGPHLRFYSSFMQTSSCVSVCQVNLLDGPKSVSRTRW